VIFNHFDQNFVYILIPEKADFITFFAHNPWPKSYSRFI